ncbi:RAS oncogene family member Rab21 isoform X2 [Amblyomma americanum]
MERPQARALLAMCTRFIRFRHRCSDIGDALFAISSLAAVLLLSWFFASYLDKRLNIAGERVHLAIWDTAGQEKFHALGPIYYRDSNGAVLVYDITDEGSFLKVKNWVKELRKMLGTDVCLTIAGNKVDLDKQRNVSAAEAEEYAASVGATHFHTSAKLNRGIDDLFLDLSKRMMQVADANDEQHRNSLGRGGNSRRTVVIVDDSPVQKTSCCGG